MTKTMTESCPRCGKDGAYMRCDRCGRTAIYHIDCLAVGTGGIMQDSKDFVCIVCLFPQKRAEEEAVLEAFNQEYSKCKPR